jgi:hypothetical protein
VATYHLNGTSDRTFRRGKAARDIRTSSTPAEFSPLGTGARANRFE